MYYILATVGIKVYSESDVVLSFPATLQHNIIFASDTISPLLATMIKC